MSGNVRKNLVARIETPGGDNPLTLELARQERPFRRGIPISLTGLKGSGGIPAYAYTITAGSLPTGLTLNSVTGRITGTPTVIGRFPFVAEVQDSAASVFPRAFSIDILSRLTVLNGTPTPAEVGIAYTYTFRTTGQTGAVTWAVTTGTMPHGLTLSSAGIVSGTPTADGISYVTVTATDAGSGDTLDVDCTVNVAQAIGTHIILGATLEVGVAFTVDGSGNLYGGVPPFTYDYTGLPAWMFFNPSTQQFFGTPPPTAITPPTFGGFPPIPAAAILGITDSLGASTTMSLAYTCAPGGLNIALQPQNTGVDVGPAGPIAVNFVGFASVTNDGYTLEVTAPSGGGVSSVNTLAGALTLTSTDGSVSVSSAGTNINLSVPEANIIRARLATAAALPTLTYANGTAGVGATLTGTGVGVLTVDAKSVALGDVLLVKDQISTFQNGAYSCTTAGAIGTAFVLTRLPGMNQTGEFTGQLVTTGPDGTTNPSKLYECTAISPVTVGTTAITFQAVGSGVGTVTSVGITLGSSGLTPTGSPVTSAGVIDLPLKTGAAHDVPASGDASSTQVVLGNDSRLAKSPGCSFDNATLAITGTIKRQVTVPYGGTVATWAIVGDPGVAGSCSIIVRHATAAAYPTMTTLFTATCTTADHASGSGSGTLAAGDILQFEGSGFALFTNANITLKVA